MGRDIILLRPPWPALGILVVVAAIGVLFYRSIAASLRQRGRSALLAPVALYSVVLGLMLVSAWATLFRPEWTPLRRGLVVVGATSLFFASDAALAWDRFVEPAAWRRLLAIVTYHLGQVGLAASIALW